jgi:3-methyladenine DNA glycosylase AlkD
MITKALAALNALADPAKAVEVAAYHKAARPYLGVSVPQIEDLVANWRAEASLDARITLAADLWRTDIHEARVAAAKLLTQARLKPSDENAWALICTWVPNFDAWAIADHACKAAEKRIMADPSRLDDVESWTTSTNMWTRRAALVATLPFAKLNHPKPDETAARDRILDWASVYTQDRDWFIQKAVAWWVRDLSKHDAPRAAQFLAEHGHLMKAFARNEAAKYLESDSA